MRIRTTLMASAALTLGLVGSAAAGPELVTPAMLRDSTSVAFECNASNATTSKTVVVRVTIFNDRGEAAAGPRDLTLQPRETDGIEVSGSTIVAHCVIEVLKGGKKSVRGALSTRGQDTIAIVAAN